VSTSGPDGSAVPSSRDVPAGTGRLRLRRFQPGDLPDVLALHREPRVRSLLVDDHALDQPALATQLLQGLQAVYSRHPGLGLWRAERHVAAEPDALVAAEAEVAAGELDLQALRWLEQGRWAFCGWFSLMPMSADAARVEIGCRLLPAAWGAGLVLDGGTRLLEHAFDTLALDAVWAACHLQHRPVQVVLQTLGFEPQGVAPYENASAARHFRIGRAQWQASRQRPLRERQREAVRHAARPLVCTPTQLAWG
jgi:RimJ/RimL family protein N-acetyltransferase